MLKVHFVANTRAGRVVWLLEELGLEYEVNIMPFTKEGLKSPEHRARHALGRVPVLEDGDISIFESGAIIQYILERLVFFQVAMISQLLQRMLNKHLHHHPFY